MDQGQKLPPHIAPFNADALMRLDQGRVGAEVNRQLAILARDVIDRPKDAMGKATPARKLKIEISMVPVLEYNEQSESHELVDIVVTPHIDGSTPTTKGAITAVRLKQGMLCYNKFVPAKFEQLPLQFSEDAEEDQPVADETVD